MSPPLKQITQTLETTPKTLAIMLVGVGEDQLSWRPAPGEWSIKEIIGHLIACDDHAFSRRIELMRNEENPTLPKWDMLGEVETRRDNDRSLIALLDELGKSRLGYAEQVRRLTPEEWVRPCRSRVGQLTIGDFAVEWAYHDYNHLAQIATNLKLSFLPHMGEEMRGAVS